MKRHSPHRAYRPRSAPKTVEDRDACALYASVHKRAEPTHEAIETALVALEKMLHRAGNVDGEGDGCGLLVDIPRRIWAEEVRAGGHNPSLAQDEAFAVARDTVPGGTPTSVGPLTDDTVADLGLKPGKGRVLGTF